MKGKVHIIVKDKEGNIKNDITQENKVFDIPRIILSEMLPLSIQNILKYSSNILSNFTHYYDNLFLSNISYIKDWFNGIKINDEFIKTNNQGSISDDAYLDWKIPQLYGSNCPMKHDTNNSRFASYDTNYSFENENVKKLYYTWANVPETFSLSSINLCHKESVGNPSTSRNTNFINSNVLCYSKYNNSRLIFKYGNFYFGYFDSNTFSDISGNTRSYLDLGYNQYYSFEKDKIQYGDRIKCDTGSSSNRGIIYPLYNNEIAVLTNGTSNSIETSLAYGARGIAIINNQTGVIKRYFDFWQLINCGQSNTGSSSSYSSYYCKIESSHINIISTPNANYLIVYTPYKAKNSSSGTSSTDRVFVYRIPDTQTTLPTPAHLTRTNDTTVQSGKSYYIRYGETSTESIGKKPGLLVETTGVSYEKVENPTGNPKTNNYYAIESDEDTIGSMGDQINPLSISTTLTQVTNNNYLSLSFPINNNLIMLDWILTFNDDYTITATQRKIYNNGNTIPTSTTNLYDANYLGRLCIPGLTYGLGSHEYNTSYPIWYNTTAINLASPVQVDSGSTLTVEYTITAN